jgi:hypothetical protein
MIVPSQLDSELGRPELSVFHSRHGPGVRRTRARGDWEVPLIGGHRTEVLQSLSALAMSSQCEDGSDCATAN